MTEILDLHFKPTKIDLDCEADLTKSVYLRFLIMLGAVCLTEVRVKLGALNGIICVRLSA